MSSVVGIVITVAVIAFVLIRRAAGSQVQWGRLAIMPLVLIAIGVSDLTAGHGTRQAVTGGDTRYLLLVGAISLVLGVIRGISVRLSTRDGVPYQRYGWPSVLLWLVTVAARIGLDAMSSSLGASGGFASKSLLLMVGISLAGESLAVVARLALRGQLGGSGLACSSYGRQGGYQGFDDRDSDCR